MSDPRDGDAPAAEALVPEIGFDPESVLSRDSRVMMDPVFLATLRGELARELPAEEADRALLQMGFLHGLQDALRVLATSAEAAFHPPLRMDCRRDPVGDANPGVRFEGSWPDRPEAEAQLSEAGRTTAPTCHASAGYTSGWLSGSVGADLLAVERECTATGSPACRFLALEAEAWRADGDPTVLARLDALPFDAFRALVRERVARTAVANRRTSQEETGVDRDAAAVHIWGPVMVIPWAGPDATLQTLDTLARDAGAAEVSVIVLDLHGAPLDEVHDALALEQLIQTAETWGTEVLFVDPSPLCDGVLAGLEPPPLLTLKDLEPAITLAFQIARSQRRTA